MLPAFARLVTESRRASEQRTLAELYAEFAADAPNAFEPLEAVLSEARGDSPTNHLNVARRQATAAAALATAGRWNRVWPLLRQSSDLTLRTYLIERLGHGGADPQTLIDRLKSDREPDVSVRRALVLALGEIEEDRLSLVDRKRFSYWLRERVQKDADAGLSSACSWLLQEWGQPGQNRASDPMLVVQPGELEAPDHNGQLRKLKVEHRFALAAREVTVSEFLRFRPQHPFDRRAAQSNDCPVNEVSWFDAAAYCNWLSSEAGLPADQWCYEPNQDGHYGHGMKVKPNALRLSGYRLATTAEWEFACRAGTATFWSMGEGLRRAGRRRRARRRRARRRG